MVRHAHRREYVKLATLIGEILLSTDYTDYADYIKFVLECDGELVMEVVWVWIELGF